MKATFFKSCFVLASTCLISTPNFAQNKKPMTPPVKMVPKDNVAGLSQVPAEVRNLMKFMGRWSSNATYKTEGKTVKGNYTFTARGTASGYGLYFDDAFTDTSSSMSGVLRSGNLVGYDKYDQKIHWFSVNSDGTTHEHIGKWKGEDTLTLEHKSTRKEKSYYERLSFVFNGKETIQFSFVATLDGKETDNISAVFQRAKPPVPVKSPGAVPSNEKKE